MSDQNDKCILSMGDLTDMLRKIGLEDDPDWIAVILFVRNIIARLECLNESDKSSLQREILDIINCRDKSKDRLSRAVKTIETSLTSGLSKKLDQTRDKLAREQKLSSNLLNQLQSIVSELKGSMEKHTLRIENFGENTISDIQAQKDPQEIISTIRKSIQVMIRDSRKEAQVWEQRARVLERTAMFDHLLTRIFNRGVFDSYLKRTVQVHKSKQTPSMCLLMIDVDNFKGINDKWGHQVGDDVLRTLSKIIKSHADLYQGIVCRYGGEELAVIFEDAGESEALQRAEALRIDTQNYEFIPKRKNGKIFTPIHFTISIGVAELDREKMDENDLIGAADKALYLAKAQGKNQVVKYSDVACLLPKSD
ncbi:MAG: diguanylate cyclase [Thermodesulfobacteriota bacterium]